MRILEPQSHSEPCQYSCDGHDDRREDDGADGPRPTHIQVFPKICDARRTQDKCPDVWDQVCCQGIGARGISELCPRGSPFHVANEMQRSEQQDGCSNAEEAPCRCSSEFRDAERDKKPTRRQGQQAGR